MKVTTEAAFWDGEQQNRQQVPRQRKTRMHLHARSLDFFLKNSRTKTPDLCVASVKKRIEKVNEAGWGKTISVAAREKMVRRKQIESQ